LLILAAVGLLWCATAGRQSVLAEALTKLADRILNGEQFAPAALYRTLAPLDGSVCRPARERDARAIITLAATWPILSSATLDVHTLEEVEARSAAALSCGPYDPLQWYLLFWAKTQLSGVRDEHLSFLRMSYRAAPHEAWLQAIRNPFVMRLYEDLPPEAQAAALDEYRTLLGRGLFAPAAQSFAGAPEDVQERLRETAERLPLNGRQDFARALAKLGLSVELDGVRDPERQRWEADLERLERMRSLWRSPDESVSRREGTKNPPEAASEAVPR
jgi:hypothetical protein